MKRFLQSSTLLTSILVLGISGCAGSENENNSKQSNSKQTEMQDDNKNSKQDEITIEDFVTALKEKGNLEMQEDNKPSFSMINASDGWMMRYNGKSVKVYLYDGEKAYQEALKQYSLLKEMFQNGNLVLETSSDEVKEIFDKLDGSEFDESKKEEEQIYQIGESAVLNNWEIILNSADFRESVEDEYFSSSAEEGNKFLVLNLTVTNNGTSASEFRGMISGGVNVKAFYNEKYEYNASTTMIEGDLSKSKVNPLATSTGFVVIEMPDTVVNAPEGIIVKMSENMVDINWKIR